MSHLFDEREGNHAKVAIDETKTKIEEEQVFVWSAVDIETGEIIHTSATRGRSNLDTLKFLQEMLQKCKNKPTIVKVDRGPWYPWALERLGLKYEQETFGERNRVENRFNVLKRRTKRFWNRFPNNSSLESVKHWLKAFAQIWNHHHLNTLSWQSLHRGKRSPQAQDLFVHFFI